MEKYLKLVNKLKSPDKLRILGIWKRILANNLKDLKIKKLKGFDNLYAVRKGKIRVVFRRDRDVNIVVNIDYRDQIYKHLG